MTIDRPRPKSWATGKGIRISPSARKTFEMCNRKWWFNKVLGLHEVSKPHLMLGSAVHLFAEYHLRDQGMPTIEAAIVELNKGRRMPDVDPEFDTDLVHRARVIFESGLRLGLLPPKLTAPGVDAMVEARVQGWCGPLPYLGFVDYAQLEKDLPNGGDPIDVLHVKDHKTCGSYYWTMHKEPLRLAKDPQMNFYAGAMMGTPTPDGGLTFGPDVLDMALDLEHIYYLTGKPGRNDPPAKRVRAEGSWDIVADVWQSYVGVAHEMLWTADKRTQDEVDANTNACTKYKGCPYAKNCNASPLNRHTSPARTAPTPTLESNMPKETVIEHLARIKREGNNTPTTETKAERKARKKAEKKAAKRATLAPSNPVDSEITPNDAAPTATPNAAQVAEVAAFYKKVRQSGSTSDMSNDDVQQYVGGLLKRKSLPSTAAMVQRVRTEAGELEALPAEAGTVVIDVTVDAGTDTTPTIDPNAKLTIFDDEAGARRIARRAEAEGVTEMDGDKFKKWIRDVYDRVDGLKRISAKMNLETKRAGERLGLWSPEFVFTWAGTPDQTTRDLKTGVPMVEALEARATETKKERKARKKAEKKAREAAEVTSSDDQAPDIEVETPEVVTSPETKAEKKARKKAEKKARNAVVNVAVTVDVEPEVVHAAIDREIAERLTECTRVGDIEQHAPGCGHILGRWLILVDCIPEGQAYQVLDTIAADWVAAVEAELASNYLIPPFNDGIHKVMSKLAAALHANAVDRSVPLYIDTRTPLGNKALDIMRRQMGVTIVRGVR